MSDITRENEMPKVTTEMMGHICDNLCKHPIRVGQTQEELDDTCVECKMNEFVGKLLNSSVGQKEIKYSEDVKLVINITEENVRDWKECRAESEKVHSSGKDCDTCSLNVDIEDTGLCDLPVVREELERRRMERCVIP